jgi:hypothetical protein
MDKELTIIQPCRIKIAVQSDGGFVIDITPLVLDSGDASLDAVK